MRDPEITLKHLSSLKENQTVTNLYRHLYNPEFYKIAYNNIASRLSNMTPTSDGSTVDGMSEERINKLIKSLRDKTYRPTPLLKNELLKKNKTSRTIGIPSFDDKLVQEIIRMLLEAIYEPHFSNNSHGYRPQKSCHTALKHIKEKAKGSAWWISLDIKDCFSSIDHTILLDILKKRIREQKFIHLINLFLKSGYIDGWKYFKTYSGVPCGGIISPILSNIYLNEVDKYIENIIVNFQKGATRKRDDEYERLNGAVTNAKRAIKNGVKVAENRARYKERCKVLRKYSAEHGCVDKFDPNFRRCSYVRYADDLLIGIIGSKKEATDIMNDICLFLKSRLKICANSEKTKVIHNSNKVNFLGYELSVIRDGSKPTKNGKICLFLPYEAMKRFIIDNRYGKFTTDPKTGKPKLKPLHRPELINIDEYEILMQYNSRIRGLYNYYKLASNVSKMAKFNYICQLSFLKTLACKYRTTCAKLYKNKNYNHRHNGAHLGVTHKGKFIEFFNGPFNVVKVVKYQNDIDIIEDIHKYFNCTSLLDRMEAHVCENCGNTEGPFEVHHVKRLKDLKGKAPWEKLMIARRRKTIVLCVKCHDKLHAGKL